MLQLILIRHANAGPYTLPDESRCLSDRGILQAHTLALKLDKKHFPVGFWLISNANRTLETAQILVENRPTLGQEIDHLWYAASGAFYMQKLTEQTESVIYLVAHNPSISYVASYVLGENLQMKTADCLHFRWPTLNSWRMVTQGSAEMVLYF